MKVGINQNRTFYNLSRMNTSIHRHFRHTNKRQTYTDYMGVLGEKCSPKWANFTLKQGENLKKYASSNFFPE